MLGGVGACRDIFSGYWKQWRDCYLLISCIIASLLLIAYLLRN